MYTYVCTYNGIRYIYAPTSEENCYNLRFTPSLLTERDKRR